MSNSVFGKTMENVRKHGDIEQQKKEETIWCWNQVIIAQFFHRKFVGNRNEESSNIYE